MGFYREEIESIWERMKMPDASKNDETEAKARGLIDAMDRSLKRLWDAFEDRKWEEVAREASNIREHMAHVIGLLDLLKEEKSL